MRYAFALLSSLVLLTGCASDEDDRAFFNQGWLHPEKGAEARMARP